MTKVDLLQDLKEKFAHRRNSIDQQFSANQHHREYVKRCEHLIYQVYLNYMSVNKT